jgi:preprotein translocase subunit SecF
VAEQQRNGDFLIGEPGWSMFGDIWGIVIPFGLVLGLLFGAGFYFLFPRVKKAGDTAIHATLDYWSEREQNKIEDKMARLEKQALDAMKIARKEVREEMAVDLNNIEKQKKAFAHLAVEQEAVASDKRELKQIINQIQQEAAHEIAQNRAESKRLVDQANNSALLANRDSIELARKKENASGYAERIKRKVASKNKN